MATRHRHETTLSLANFDGDELELKMVVEFDFSPGSPESGAGYMADPAGYDAGSPDEVVIRSLRLVKDDGTREFEALAAAYFAIAKDDEAFEDSLAAAAREGAAADRDAALEARADDARIERRIGARP